MARVKNSGTSRLIDPLPIYIMWLREMKRIFRVKARLVSNLLMPILFLAFLGIPLSLVSANGSEMFGLPGSGFRFSGARDCGHDHLVQPSWGCLGCLG